MITETFYKFAAENGRMDKMDKAVTDHPFISPFLLGSTVGVAAGVPGLAYTMVDKHFADSEVPLRQNAVNDNASLIRESEKTRRDLIKKKLGLTVKEKSLAAKQKMPLIFDKAKVEAAQAANAQKLQKINDSLKTIKGINAEANANKSKVWDAFEKATARKNYLHSTDAFINRSVKPGLAVGGLVGLGAMGYGLYQNAKRRHEQ